MGPLLSYWHQQGMVAADASAGHLLADQRQAARTRADVLLRAALELADRAAAERLRITLLKGAHTAHVYFPGADTRPAADIDVLVKPADLLRLHRILADLGLVQTRSTQHPYRSEWEPADGLRFPRSLDREDAASPWAVDVHTHLDRRYYRGVTAGFGAMGLEHSVEWSLAGRVLRGLAQPLLAAFLSLHASYALPGLRLLRIVELVLVVRADTARGWLRWEALLDLVTRTGTERFVYPALELAERLAPGTVPGEVRRRLTAAATPRMQRLVRQVDEAGMHLPRRSLDEKLMWTTKPTEVLVALAELLWPGDDAVGIRDALRFYGRRVRMLAAGQIRLRARVEPG